MMEFLEQYDTDSDSSVDDSDGVDVQHQNKYNTDIIENMPPKSQRDEEPGSTTTDYLGLCSGDTSDDDSSDTTEVCHIPSKRKRPTEQENKLYDFSKRGSSFWEHSLEDNWSNPNIIWKDCSASGSRSRTSNVAENHPAPNNNLCDETEGQKHKKSHSSEDRRESPGGIYRSQKGETCSVNKSAYFVHHHINSQLYQDRKPCRFSSKKLTDLSGHTEAVNRVQWCTSQYSHLLASCSMDRTIKIWNVFSSVSQCVQQLCKHKKAVRDICWSVDGKQVLSCSYDKTARITDVETGDEICCCEEDGFVSCGQYHPVNRNLFVIGGSNTILCYDCRDTSRPVQRYVYKDNFGQVQDIAIVKDGNHFFSCNDLVSRDSADRTIMAWDFRTGVVFSNQIYQERYTCSRLKVHPSDSIFVVQTQGDYIAEFSSIRPYKMNCCKKFQGHKVAGYNIGCDFSPDGKMIASGSSDGNLVFYNYLFAKNLKTIAVGRHDPCVDVAWHPVLPSTVATASWSGVVSVWQ